MSDNTNGYELSRIFWDFAFNNPEKIRPVHAAIYFFAVEHCNRLGWKNKFGLPTSMVLEAVGIKSYSVYKKAFDELVEFNFFEVIQYSKNQYSSNVIALKENSKAKAKALDKAIVKHVSKQTKSTDQSTVSIDKPLTINQEQLTIKNEILNSQSWLEATAKNNGTDVKSLIEIFDKFWTLQVYETNKENKTQSEIQKHFGNWLKTNKPKEIKFVDEWGKYEEDYYCAFFSEKTEPEKYKEAIEAGFVKYSDTELRFKIIKKQAQ